jgi:hypothetical protein
MEAEAAEQAARTGGARRPNGAHSVRSVVIPAEFRVDEPTPTVAAIAHPTSAKSIQKASHDRAPLVFRRTTTDSSVSPATRTLMPARVAVKSLRSQPRPAGLDFTGPGPRSQRAWRGRTSTSRPVHGCSPGAIRSLGRPRRQTRPEHGCGAARGWGHVMTTGPGAGRDASGRT